MDASIRRVVILGKTGTGKSNTANTIFGENLFKVDQTSQSGTSKCQAETRSVNGRRITLIDTPGLFDNRISEEDLKPEIVRCITECSPGPQAFFILLKVERYTEHEEAVITKITEYFSDEAFKYATVVFTHGDQLQERQTIEDFVCKNNSLAELVEKCGGRCHVIDNRYWKENPTDKYRSNKFQVEQLLQTIDTMIEENNDGCYTNEMLQAVERKLQEEEKRIMRTQRVSVYEARRRAKDKVQGILLLALAGVAAGVLFGAFLGLPAAVGIAVAAAGLAVAENGIAVVAGGVMMCVKSFKDLFN